MIDDGPLEDQGCLTEEVSVRTRSKWWWAAIVAVLTLVVAACGGGSAADDERTVIRFAFAPDPVWDYMNDQGMIVAWEEEFNTRIVTTSTWDEFTFFAGGHGDIVSMGTQEIPVLEQETGIDTVTFGKYNYQRVPMMTRADTGYNDLTDVPPGSKICVSGPTSNTGFWTVAANELHGLDYRVGGGDFDLIVNDHFVNPQNLLNGDCEAAAIIPEAAAPYLRTGELVLMYDGQAPFQLYRTFSPTDDGQKHVMSNLFTSTKEFADAHPEALEAFLVLWQRGIDAWSDPAIQAEIIETYPQHFAVEKPEDIAFIQDYMAGDGDWFVDSVYLESQDWIDNEQAIWDFMTELNPDNANYLEPGFEKAEFIVIAPPS
jgi:ABC-type nitrate/sulfonate/bicarbonate transport system substrate-binding protein